MNKKNKKLSVVLACFACLLTLIGATLGVHIFADDNSYNLTVSTGYTPEAEVPLNTKVSTNEFYFNGNINPGDTLDANILFENTSDEYAIKITISEILNLLGDDDKAIELLNELQLTISVDEKIIYKGSHGKTTAPVIGWIEIPANGNIVVNISIYFPKEADNTYQNSPLKVKYVFESQIDIPDDFDEEVPEFSEKVPTGVDDTDDTNYATLIIAIGVSLIILYIIVLIIRAILKKKKKEKSKDSNKE